MEIRESISEQEKTFLQDSVGRNHEGSQAEQNYGLPGYGWQGREESRLIFTHVLALSKREPERAGKLCLPGVMVKDKFDFLSCGV